MKKIAVILIFMAMLTNFLAIGFPIAVSADDTLKEPAPGQKELLKNGDFETESDGSLKSWTPSPKSKWGTGLGPNITHDKVHSGKTAVKLINDGTEVKDSHMTQKLKLIPGATYQASAWIYVESLGTAGPLFSCALYDAKYKSLPGVSLSIKNVPNGRWTQVVKEFVTPETPIGEAEFRVRLFGGDGVVYYDDISLYAVKVPDKIIEAEKEEDIVIIPPFEFKEPAPGQPELLKNGGFEELNSAGKGVKDWTPIGAKWNEETGVSVVQDKVHSGKYAVKLINDLEASDSHLTQKVKLIPRARYQASVWINVEEMGKGKIVYSMAYYSGNFKKYHGGYLSDRFMYGNRYGEWIQYIAHFEALEMGDCEVEFRLRMNGGDGIAYFDDVSLYMIAPPKRMSFSTSEVLYYTELKNGFATAVPDLNQYPELVGSTVDFRIKDRDKVIAEKLNASTQGDNIARYYFDLTALEIQKDYTVEAVLKDKSGAVLETQTETIQRFLPRPTALSEEGFYLKDGKPVNIMLAYTRPEPMNDASLLEPLADQGVSVFMQGSRAKEDDIVGRALDDAQSKGLMAIVGIYPGMKPAGHPDNVENTEYYVTKYKDHPALFGWAVLDEPSAYFKDELLDKLMLDSYKLIRSIDPVHPVYAVEATTEFLPLISRSVDILATDPYPWSSKPIAGTPATFIRAASEAAEYVKPTLSLTQVCELQGYFPSVMESRHQWYQSLFEGATMLGYYSYRLARPNQILSETEIWPGLVEFGREEQNEAFNNLVYRKYPIFSESSIVGADAWWSGYIKDGALYMMVLNMDEENRNAVARTIDIPLKSDGGTVEINGFTAELVYGEGIERIEGSGSTLSLPLEQNAAVVYKITPKSPTDFSALKTTKFRDLGKYSWAAEQIRELESRGIVEGLTAIAYRPGYKITRGDFVMNLIRTLGLTSDSTENFSDVPSTSRYAKEIAIGKALGILKGAGDGKFNPDAEISRQDMMTIIARGMGLTGEGADLSAFSDAGSIADYALDGVKAMVKEGIVKGNADGTINPQGNATRAEAAVIMYRILGRQ